MIETPGGIPGVCFLVYNKNPPLVNARGGGKIFDFDGGDISL